MSPEPPPRADLSPEPGSQPSAGTLRWLRALVEVERHEVAAMLWSAALFFAILCSYYVIRPLRDTMGLTGGVKSLPWMFTATLAAMLLAVPVFAAVVVRWPRQVFIPWVFRGFGVQLLMFFAALQIPGEAARVIVARIFFVWAAVFSLFVVSVFWGYMADIWRREQGERLFGFIAAGGTLGALAGPALTAALVETIGPANLLLLSVLGLELAVLCVHRLGRVAGAVGGQGQGSRDAAIGGGIFAGFTLVLASPRLLGICGYVLLLAFTGTFLYLEQMTIVEVRSPSPRPARPCSRASTSRSTSRRSSCRRSWSGA